jgi:phenylacetate-CoA ligase
MIRVFYHALMLMRRHGDPALIARSKKNALRTFAERILSRSQFHVERLAEAGLSPPSLRHPDQIGALPIMERSDLMNRLDEIAIRPNTRKSWRELRTSGSSGNTLCTWVTRREAAIRQALHLRSRILAGRKFWHRGAVIGSQAVNAGPAAKRNWRGIYLSAADDPRALLPELRRLMPDYLVAFPSTLLRMGADHGLRPKLITTGSEVLDIETRELIESRFRAPVRDIYGAIETGLLAFQCSEGRGYHLNEDLVHFEFLPSSSDPDLAEVLVTPLYAEAVPLVRYRLGDRVRLGNQSCRCGSALPTIASIEGRRDDWLLRPDGREIAPAAVRAIFRACGRPLSYRVTQVDGHGVYLELDLYGDSILIANLQRTLAEMCGWPVELRNGHIEPDPSGKLRAIRRVAELPAEWRPCARAVSS